MTDQAQPTTDLARLRDVMLAMEATMDRAAILSELNRAITDTLHFDRGLVMLCHPKDQTLIFATATHKLPDAHNQLVLEQIQIELENTENDPLIVPWLKGQPVFVEDPQPYLTSRFQWVIKTLGFRLFYSVPLKIGNRLTGVLIIDNSPTGRAITLEQRTLLEALAAHIAITLESARLYQLTDEQLDARVRELEILSRIDRELNYTLSVERVFNLLLDWALRFTNSHAALLALVDCDKASMEFITAYGYPPGVWENLRGKIWPFSQGITGRAARNGQAENVSDVTLDPDYVEIMPMTRSQLSVPVLREDCPVAVISLESPTPGAFSTANLEFVQRLAARASVAVANAHLYDETRRERQKLELILSNTADAVVVVDNDGNLVLVNQAAMAAFHLPPKDRYAGRPFIDVFEFTRLAPLYERAVASHQGMVEELTLPDNRTLHVRIVPEPEVGWSIVMHDITPFKETDKLKNELLATTSHDLKSPLTAIGGYVELIQMTNPLNEHGQEYLQRVRGAANHMRQLIDDLLDMARIESGITLRYSRVKLLELVNVLADQFQPQLTEKAMSLEVQVPSDLPIIPADEGRLKQILTNLISNAIKYTPPEGHVWVRAEPSGQAAKIAVQDDGLGISPEDQAHIFTRFYRVRTPETESIDGTGLGLSIVKSLVERHGGQIGLESRLGAGTTVFFTLPLTQPTESEWLNGR
ncbi:MAG: GAF domain-containing protein [Chloroflexi bacterium]|nr:GAF domain-containing protein [Chloroflexota bacterium]